MQQVSLKKVFQAYYMRAKGAKTGVPDNPLLDLSAEVGDCLIPKGKILGTKEYISIVLFVKCYDLLHALTRCVKDYPIMGVTHSLYML